MQQAHTILKAIKSCKFWIQVSGLEGGVGKNILFDLYFQLLMPNAKYISPKQFPSNTFFVWCVPMLCVQLGISCIHFT